MEGTPRIAGVQRTACPAAGVAAGLGASSSPSKRVATAHLGHLASVAPQRFLVRGELNSSRPIFLRFNGESREGIGCEREKE